MQLNNISCYEFKIKFISAITDPHFYIYYSSNRLLLATAQSGSTLLSRRNIVNKHILTFFAIDVVQKVDAVFHNAITYIAIIPEK